MNKLCCTPTGAVLVAIDMSKNRQEVLIERPEGGRRRRMTVMATKEDYDNFAEQLAAIGRPIVVGFEATGNYHRTLAHRLLTAGFELRLISSVALARTREALHNGWDKNDSKDAQVILHMLRIGATQRYVDPLAAGINDLQELSKTHEVVSKMKTQTWHRILTHYLPLYFPEIARFAGNSRSDWFLALIERFPTPTSITALDRDAFSAEAWPLIGRKVSKARLINDVYETACSSAALPVPEDSIAITMFRMVIAQGRSLIHQRDEIERLAHARLAEHLDYQLLRNIPGIGPINALTILAEAGDLRRFNHPYRALANLRRKLVHSLAGHDCSFSQIGASGKPGTLHSLSFASLRADSSSPERQISHSSRPRSRHRCTLACMALRNANPVTSAL